MATLFSSVFGYLHENKLAVSHVTRVLHVLGNECVLLTLVSEKFVRTTVLNAIDVIIFTHS